MRAGPPAVMLDIAVVVNSNYKDEASVDRAQQKLRMIMER